MSSEYHIFFRALRAFRGRRPVGWMGNEQDGWAIKFIAEPNIQYFEVRFDGINLGSMSVNNPFYPFTDCPPANVESFIEWLESVENEGDDPA